MNTQKATLSKASASHSVKDIKNAVADYLGDFDEHKAMKAIEEPLKHLNKLNDSLSQDEISQVGIQTIIVVAEALDSDLLYSSDSVADFDQAVMAASILQGECIKFENRI